MPPPPQLVASSPVSGPAPRVLIVRIGSMGDVLHALPAVAALRGRLPHCEIGWAVDPRWAPLLAAADGSAPPIVSRLHLAPTRAWKRSPLSPDTLGGLAALRRALKAAAYDIAIDLQGSIKSAVVARMAGAERLVGSENPRERPAGLLYTEIVPAHAANVIDQACELIAAALGDSLSPVAGLRPASVRFPVDAPAEAWCSSTLAQLAIGERGFVLLCPTAGWPAKEWPVAHFRALAERLHAAGLRVLVNAIPGDALSRVIADGTPASIVLCSVAELIALTRRAHLVIGGDTGPMHLAAALGIPTVALFGPTDPARTSPSFVGARVRILRHTLSTTDHTRHAQTEPGLAQMSPDEVATAAFELIEQPVPAEVMHG